MKHHYPTLLAIGLGAGFAVCAHRSGGEVRAIYAGTAAILWGIAMLLDALSGWRRI